MAMGSLGGMMPYIEKKQRVYLQIAPEVLLSVSMPGQLNYLFTEIIIAYIKNLGESYHTYNDIIGALEACKMELYRRKVVDYENKKIQQNSDVY